MATTVTEHPRLGGALHPDFPPAEHPARDFKRDIDREAIRQSLFESSPPNRSALKLGRYQLEEQLGVGGMGEVYSAYDPQLDRRVAIKIVRRTAGNGGVLHSALVREARHAARVKHPHVVQIHDCGVADDEFFIVMDLIEGETLQQWLDGRRRSWRDILEIFLQAGRGLASVHEHGIVHRDFKPTNVLVAGDGRAWVVDFGLARAREDLRMSRSSDDESPTTSPEVGGTPSYMAPEQYETGAVTHHADQFAYCNALYRALFHAPPFEGQSSAELATNVIRGALKRPRLRHGAPRALVRLVVQGLAAHPEDRHRSMDELLKRLRGVLRRRRRIAWVVGLATVATAATLAGYGLRPEPCASVGGAWTAAERGQVEVALRTTSPDVGEPTVGALAGLDAYAEQWQDAREQVCEDDRQGASTELSTALRTACLDRKAASFRSVWARVAAEQGSARVKAAGLVRIIPPVSDCRPEAVLETASMANAFASQTDRSASPEAELRWAELSAKLAEARVDGGMARYDRAHAQAHSVALAARRLGLGYLFADALRYRGIYGLKVARNEEQQAQARRDLENAGPLALESGSNRLAANAYLAWAQAEPRWSPLAVLQSHLIGARSLARTLPDEPSSRSLLARIDIARADLMLADGRHDDAIALYEQTANDTEEEHAAVYAAFGLANARYYNGETDAAKKIWQQLRSKHEQHSPNEPILVEIYMNLSVVAMGASDYDQALHLARLAEQAHRDNNPNDRRQRLEIRLLQGRALKYQGESEDAARVLTGVIAGLEALGQSGWNLRSEARGVLIDALQDHHDLTRAMRVAHEQLEFVGRWNPDELAHAQAAVAEVALKAGDAKRALAVSTAAYNATRNEAPGWGRAEVEYAYAKAVYTTGDPAKARDLFLELDQMLQNVPNSAGERENIRRWAEERGLHDDERSPR